MNREIFMELLRQREFKAVRSVLNVMNAVDIASLLSELEDKELTITFRLIPKEKSCGCVQQYEPFDADVSH